MELKLRKAPINSGLYIAKVLDCYLDCINTRSGSKEVIVFNFKICIDCKYYNVKIMVFYNEYENSESERLIAQIVENFNYEDFRPEYLIGRLVEVDLTTTTDYKGNEYMHIRHICPTK